MAWDDGRSTPVQVHTEAMVALAIKPIDIPPTLRYDVRRIAYLRLELDYLALAASVLMALSLHLEPRTLADVSQSFLYTTTFNAEEELNKIKMVLDTTRLTEDDKAKALDAAKAAPDYFGPRMSIRVRRHFKIMVTKTDTEMLQEPILHIAPRICKMADEYIKVISHNWSVFQSTYTETLGRH